MMLMVVSQMAPLTHRPKVGVVAVLRRVIQMRDRQNHDAASAWMRLAVLGVASLAFDDLFAAPGRALETNT